MSFSNLVGKTLIEIKQKVDEIIFVTATGERYLMYHSQDCCESVSIDDVCGDWSDILNTPVVSAFEASSSDSTFSINNSYGSDSYTWTFYKIDTVKGGVTIRWYGCSNGYYSESVGFELQ